MHDLYIQTLCATGLDAEVDNCVAESKRVLISALLNECHSSVRSVCRHFLERVAQLDAAAHHWVLQLLSDNMQEADSKPQHCLVYYDMFGWTMTTMPQQGQPVSMYCCCLTYTNCHSKLIVVLPV